MSGERQGQSSPRSGLAEAGDPEVCRAQSWYINFVVLYTDFLACFLLAYSIGKETRGKIQSQLYQNHQ